MPGGFLPIEGAIQRTFAAGELAPALHARADLTKYVSGLRTCRNFMVLRSGGVANRAGLRYIATCKTNSAIVQLVSYVSEIAGESIVIEAGTTYLRFFKNGAAVLVSGVPAWSAVVQYVIGDIVASGGVNYYARAASLNQVPPNATYWYAMPAGNLLELPSPFPNLFAWSQSGRTLTLTHEDIAPHELTYEALTRWVLSAVSTAPKTPAPTGVTLTPGAAGARRFAYVVTAAGPDYEESLASAQVINAACAVPTEAAPHVIAWGAVAGATEYYVYGDPYNNNTYGFLGTATGVTTFNDVGFTPDFLTTPPLARVLFASANNYPKVSATYQQRRFFGYTKNVPDGVEGSRIGFPSNFAISSPLQEDDPLAFRLAASQHNPVRHLVAVKQLVVLTDAGEWLVRGDAQGTLRPGSIEADQHTYVGCSSIRPVVIGNSIIYVQARGSIIRDVQFNQDVEGLAGRDLTVYATHLFDKGRTIRGIDYAQAPDSIVWVVRDDGVLLGMTYLREQEIAGWHRHDTATLAGQSLFWSVCVVPEATGDSVYVIVRRSINGATVRYIERLEPRDIDPTKFDQQCFFVDCGLSYSGAPVNNVSGLGHLEAEVVAVVGDGAVIFDGNPAASNAANFTVTAGTLPVNLPATYSNIHVGLAIRYPELETLDLDTQGAALRDKVKRSGILTVLVDRSSRSFRAGPSAGPLQVYTPPPWEPGADEFSGQVEVNISSSFDRYGRVFIRQSDPLPLTILAIIPAVELGG